MKAKELLRLYQAGERNFCGENLRGQSFQGQDLSGADFREVDIRGANFSRANLIGSKFTSATAGLQRRWAVSLVIVTWFIAVVSGLLSGFVGHIVGLLFSSEGIDPVITSWSCLVVLAVFL